METKTECSEFHKNSRFSYNEPQKKKILEPPISIPESSTWSSPNATFHDHQISLYYSLFLSNHEMEVTKLLSGLHESKLHFQFKFHEILAVESLAASFKKVLAFLIILKRCSQKLNNGSNWGLKFYILDTWHFLEPSRLAILCVCHEVSKSKIQIYKYP